MKRSLLVALVTLSGLSTIQAQQPDKTLWYRQPAQYFEESLVLGNGTQGASIFGGVQSDKIFLNDATLWSGEPVRVDSTRKPYQHVPAIQEALKNEDYKGADQLNRKLQGKFSESYAPLGTLYLNFNHGLDARNFYRQLNLADAISSLHYVVDGVTYTREYFMSQPDQIMVIRVSSSWKGALNFSLKMTSQLKNWVVVAGNTLKIRGNAPVHSEPNYQGNKPDAVVFDPNRGTRFTTLAKIKTTDGRVVTTDSTL